MKSHDYYARINGKDYPIAWGFQIVEELGETLDSGSIAIPHLFEIIPLKPYDDVIIHDYAPNASPEEGGLPNRALGAVFTVGEGHFYKHMVVASYTREKVNLADEAEKTDDDGKKYFSRAYNYRIQLKSETCKLETVQLPNRTITQPMSLADGEASEALSANFAFGADTKKYTLPYGAENSSAGKSFHLIEEVKENQSALNIDDWRVLHAYVGDDVFPTADYSSFMTMAPSARQGSVIVLPDWAISGVSTVQEDFRKGLIGIKYFDSWGEVSIHHPKKHWIVRKLNGKSNKGWESRAIVVERIKKYLSGTDDSEIINSKLTGKDGSAIGRDISSGEPISILPVVFPSEDASYIVYLYCEPEIVSVESLREGEAAKKANLYGMTDNSNGVTRPAESDEFLCSWGTEAKPFSISSATETSKGALSVYEAVRQAVELYSPYLKAKESADSDEWSYRRKFSVGGDVKAIFSSVAAPENQWNCPNLRDYITRLMYVKDCIPVVRDNVIGCMSLSKRGVVPFDGSKGLFGIESYAMDGDSYCDRLIRTYSDGLSKDNVVSCVERTGFRNSDSATLTLDALRLELSHPIYRITKILMCHYNDMTATTSAGAVSTYSGVVKHDITPLVLMNSQRNLLSEDWASLNAATPKSLKELAKFKYATVGYDVGSRHITGWGAKYTYPSCVFWSGSKTVIENIFTFAHKLAPYGLNSFSLRAKLQELAGSDGSIDPGASVFTTGADGERKALYSSNVGIDSAGTSGEQEWGSETASELQTIDLGQTTYGGVFTNLTQKMKSLFFIVEYEGYVSASVVASKDFHDGDVVSRDNASSSLSFVESDGANQKEKVNRLGNAIVTQPVRCSSLSDVQELSQVWDGYSLSDEEISQGADVDASGRAKEHDDEVLYQRMMVFERDFVQASYTFCRNYVLRNYFTSVFAKRRPYALASYDESVERQENRTIQLRFSADSCYYQPESESKVANYSESTLIPTVLSFFKATEYDADGVKTIEKGVDSCYYMVFPSDNFAYSGQCGVFAADCQKFTSGNSACFSVSMQDSASAGVFVSDWNPTLGSYIGNLVRSRLSAISSWKNGYSLASDDVEATNLLTGSKQNWLMLPVDPDTGELYSMRFGVGFKENDYYAIGGPGEVSAEDEADYQLLPLMDAVIISADGATYTWFGKVTVDEALDVYVGKGHGAPRLVFERNGSLYAQNGKAYRVDFSNASLAYLRDDWVHEWNASSYSSVFFGDERKSGRQEIREFLSAKFVGRETESSDETDTCVFKDGKERISVTMQIEPVSEDSRVLFSDRMMKLSDAIGGCEKNYAEVDFSEGIKAIVGLSQRKFENNATQTGHLHLDWHFRGSASIPSVTILVPSGASFGSVAVDKTFLWEGSGVFYSITVLTIDGFTSDGNLIATCEISSSGSSAFTESVTFAKMDDSSDYVTGRTGVSTFAKTWTLFLSTVQSGYDAYAMVEDAFFQYKRTAAGATAEANAVFDDSVYVNQTGAGFIGGNTAGSSLSYSSSEGSLIAVGTDSFPSMPLSIPDSRSSVVTASMSYSLASDDASTSQSWGAVSLLIQDKEPVHLASIADESKAKSRNMFWVKAPLMGSRETSWDVRSSLDDSEFDVIEGITEERESVVPYTTAAVITCLAKAHVYVSKKMSIPSSIISEAFDQNAHEIESVSIELASYDILDGDKLKASSVSITDMGDGDFMIIGQGYMIATSTQTASLSVTLNVKVRAKKLIPVSVEQDSRGLWRLRVALEEPLTGERSIRLYYKEGGGYHFVFGANLGAKADEGKSGDVIYPSDDAGKVYYVYVSALDDRSKTVIDAETGDPTYRVVDWLDGEHEGRKPYNACVKKG